MSEDLQDGYYWARHRGLEEDGTTFIVLRQDGDWFCCGVGEPISRTFSESQVICRCARPDN